MQPSSQELYRVAQIREAERIAIEELQIPGMQLMLSAGLAAFNALQQRWPDVYRLSVFCGGGNNAGDGYVLAKLALQAGFNVVVYSVADTAALKGDALTAYQDYVRTGGRVLPCEPGLKPGGIVADALLGTGLSREVSDEYAMAISLINASGCPVLALDVPSGLHADSGSILGCAVQAGITVTFIALKCGLFTGEAANYCGDVVCSSLNVPDSVLAKLPVAARLLDKKPLPPRLRASHKGHFGHVLLVGGNHGYSGAIRLAGEAALRAGAGLVSIATRAAHSAVLNCNRPELMCHAVEEPSALRSLLDKATAVVIGPGLGRDEWARALFAEALASGKPCVLDADALNLLAEQPARRDDWILTPHPGEASRLLACSTRDIGGDRFAAVRNLQQRYGGVIVLKGAGSLVADDKDIFVDTTGNPGMASGGMGDVLAGMLGALSAQGLASVDATKLAVYVHGEAADIIAEEHGERGMLASDLLAKIRELLN